PIINWSLGEADLWSHDVLQAPTDHEVRIFPPPNPTGSWTSLLPIEFQLWATPGGDIVGASGSAGTDHTSEGSRAELFISISWWGLAKKHSGNSELFYVKWVP
ncbi:MAG: hypothetical protein RMJ19_04095, partial [Gemmatales bacterium]|nr:hypothetical protein [Gemmatales bacterium]MDW8174828.1 hypothetical protein [Gemmatales bacterium]